MTSPFEQNPHQPLTNPGLEPDFLHLKPELGEPPQLQGMPTLDVDCLLGDAPLDVPGAPSAKSAKILTQAPTLELPGPAEVQVDAVTGQFQSQQWVGDLDPLTSSATNEPIGRAIVFIDPTVPDYQSLLAGVDPTAEVIVLDATQDGVQQITDALAQRQGIAAVHIVAHGDAGSLQLGSTELSAENLATYSDRLQSWSQALTDRADLLLYGCNVAAGTVGATFVQQISSLTGADVAASDDLTGSASQQADWVLETTTGAIESGLAFQPATLATYQGTLVDILAPEKEAILGGLQGVISWVDNLEQYAQFGQALPIVGESLGKAIDFSNTLQAELLNRVNNYFTNDLTFTTGELASSLDALPLLNVTDASTANEIKFTVGLEKSQLLTNQAIDLGTSGAALGLSLTGKIDLNANLETDFSFGFNRTSGLAAAEAFFIDFDQLSATGSFNASLDGSKGKVGFLEVAIASGSSFSLNAGVSALINGGNALTLAALQGSTIDNLVSLAPTQPLNTPVLSATLPVSVTLNGFSPIGTPTIQVSATAEQIFNGQAPTVSVTNFDPLLDFKNLTPGDMLNLLSQLGGKLQEIVKNSSAGLNFDIPFVGDAANEALDFVETLTDLTNDLIDVTIAGNTISGTLSNAAQFQLAVNGDTEHPFTISLDPTTGLNNLVNSLNTKLQGIEIVGTNLEELVEGANDLGDFLVAESTDSDGDGTSDRLVFKAKDAAVVQSFVLSAAAGNPAITELGLGTSLNSAVQLKFDSLQAFIAELNQAIQTAAGDSGFDANLTYHAASGGKAAYFTFDLTFDREVSEEIELDLSEGLDLGTGGSLDLGNLSFSGTADATLTAKTSLDLGIGVDLSPIGADFNLTGSTLLTALPGGNKLVLDPTKDDLGFRLKDNTLFTVKLSGLTTVQQIIDAIQTASGGKLLVETNNTTKGLTLRDTTTGEQLLAVTAINGSLAGFVLRILGIDNDRDGVIEGGSLHGDSLFKNLFIKDGSQLTLEAAIAANDIDVSAGLGVLQLGIQDGETTDPFTITANVTLDDVDSDGQITIDQLSPSVLDVSATASGQLELPIAFEAGELDLLGVTENLSNAKIVVGLEASVDPTNGLQVNPTVQFPDVDLTNIIEGFRDFSFRDVLKLVGQVIDTLQQSSQGAELLNTSLPLINTSINELLGFVQPIIDGFNEVTSKLEGLQEDLISKLAEFKTLLNSNTTIRDQLEPIVEQLERAILAVPLSFDTLAESGVDPWDAIPAVVSAIRATGEALDELASSSLKTNLLDKLGEVRELVPSASTLVNFLLQALGVDLPNFNSDLLQNQILGTITNQLNALTAQGSGNTADLSALTNARNALQAALTNQDYLGLISAFADIESAIAALNGNSGLPAGYDFSALSGVVETLIDQFPSRFGFDFSFDSLTNTLGVDFDFDVIKRASIDDIDFSLGDAAGPLPLSFNFDTGANFGIELGAALSFDFAVDLDDRELFLLETTKLDLTAELVDDSAAAGIDVVIGAQLAGFGVSLGKDEDGQRGILSLNDQAGAGPAKFSIAITDEDASNGTSGRVALTDLDTNKIQLGFDAKLGINLPVFLVIGSSVEPVEVNGNPYAITADISLTDIDDLTVNFEDINVDGLLDAIADNIKLDLRVILEGVDAFLQLLENGLKSQFLAQLPIIGDDINLAGSKIGDFRTKLYEPLKNKIEKVINDGPATVEAAIRQVLWDNLSPLGLFVKANTATADPDDFVTLTNIDEILLASDGASLVGIDNFIKIDIENLSSPEAMIQLHLGGSDTLSAAFDIGLSGLGLGFETSGAVEVNLGFDFQLGFGLNKQGAFLQLNNDPDDLEEIEFSLDVGLKGTDTDGDGVLEPARLAAQLFFLTLTATDNGDTGFTGEATLDLETSNVDQRMSLFDFSNVKLTPQLEAAAQINLALQTGLSDGVDGGSLEINQNLPSIKTDLEIDWGFELGTSGFHSDELSVVLKDVRLDIGDFLGEAIAPILKAVDQALDPIRPLLDILNTKIPVLSDLSELFGSGPVTFLDAFSLFGSGGESAKDIIRVVSQIAQFVDDAAEFAAAGDVVLNFGTFDLTNLDLSAPAIPGGLDFGQVRDGSGNPFSDFSFDDALNSISGPDSNQVQNSRTVLTSLNASDGLGITFPILSPENIFKLLFGQTADLVKWQLPVLSAEFSFSQRFGPIIPPFPIFAELGGALSMFADFRVGLDTRGLETGNFLDGFFFDDFKNGVEAPELGLSAQFTAGAALSLGIASAGVRGGIRADITADWNDPVPDSKIYGDELLLNISRGLDCVFDLHGAFKAFLEAFVEVELLFTSWRETFELASVTLFEFNHSCPPIEPDPAGLSNGSNYGDLAAGTLVIHTGQFTSNRFPGATDGDDEVLVTLRDENAESRDFDEDGVRGLVWEVKVNGDTEYFKSSDVSRIYVDGGEGNDRITIKSSTSSGQNLAIATTILGGNGDDQIQGGTGTDVIRGGAGKDNTQGGDGDDNIDGGIGNDQIFGNVGKDNVDGGIGDDVLHGDDQNAAQAGLVYDDLIKGGEGNDQIFGEHGNDNIDGGDGNDRIKGGDGIDTIKGGQGIDIIDGDRGNDDIEGGADADVLSGNAGNDTVRGGAGDDQITDLEGNNQLYGEGGNDQITAGGGSDLLDGGADNDTLAAGAGDDYLEGGTGNDTLQAGEGSDRLIGGSSTASAGDADGDDLLYGEGGDDILLGDHGTISTAGVISRIGGAGNDQLFGGTGNDTADGQGGNDLIEGGIGRDRLFGGTGDDTVRGQEDDDYIEGGAGSDQLFGGQGDDAIIGGVSALADLGGQLDGSDLIQGDAGNDVLLGDNGTIAIAAGIVTAVTTEAQGGAGGDHIFGGVGNDILFGGGQGDLLVGDDANNSGDDIIVGDQGSLDATGIRSQASAVAGSSGNDNISGSGGDDIALGGGGDDQISGDQGLDILLGDHGVVTRNGGVVTRIATSDPEEGGTDTITGGTEDDVALGGTENDNISGGTGADILLGDNGVVVRNDGSTDANDIFSQAPTFGGRDTINGDAGDDIIVGGSGGIDTSGVNGDQLFGNDGNDVVVGDNARITRNSSDVIERISTILPEHGGDDTLEGNAGDDILIGGSGSDRITGNAGSDIALGDNGTVVRHDGSPEANDVFSTDPSFGGIDQVDGGEGDDILLGGTAGDDLKGQAGQDVIAGDHAYIQRSSADVIERISSRFDAIGGDDKIEGNTDADIAIGGVGNDQIWGGEDTANDILLGDNGVVVRNDGTTDANDILTQSPTLGGEDTIHGGAGNDIIIGGSGGTDAAGSGGDKLFGEAGDDIVVGDNARITRNNADVVEQMTTTDTNQGGDDAIAGAEGDDILIGGFGEDTITGAAGCDIALGDNGKLDYTLDGNLNTLDLATTTAPCNGDSDTIDVGADNDLAFGGTGGDNITAGSGNDLVFGDHGKVEGVIDLNALPLNQAQPPFTFTAVDTQITDCGGDEIIHGSDGDDIILGQQGNDQLFGDAGDDDLIGGHNVAGGADGNDAIDGGTGNDVVAGDNAKVNRQAQNLSPRMRVLKGAVIYDENGNPQVSAATQPNPTGAAGRSIELLDHAVDTPAARFGHDQIAGGAGDDLIFGQLGNDTLQGDSAIAESVSTTDPSVEAATDGDDYIEGGGGDDLIFGNLGQDDIIGGSSNLFGNDTTQERPDGKDTIFGGAGTRIARNDAGDTSAEGHARDADTIVGDNGNIFRLVGTNGVNSGSFLKFTYENYSNHLRIIPRAIELLDYVQGGSPNNLGSDDLIHGEAGDDTIHGMTGNDVVFGEGQDDDIYGGPGSDRLYGGTGEDGIVGDDGKILTSRNGQTETLYSITTPNQETAISLPGPFTGAVINITGRLKKEVDLVAFDQGGNDVIYGGLGDDFLHGGAGDDAISGAEALAEFYNSNPVTNLNPLNYDPVTRKLAAYDANNPRQKINGFLLNFEATDANGNKIDDGKDNIFGDLGNDWLVGGTLNDRLFGGLGDDVLNADDNHDTNGGKNNAPDAPEFADGDFAFGGGGLDVMIANTGKDRLFDWNGEFNTYVVPFSPFGEPTVVRAPSPQIFEFLLALGKASGADRSLAEPNGELGLVTQKNPQWQDQQGSPRDPQPGNLPGVQRDTQGGPEDDSASGSYFRRNGVTARTVSTASDLGNSSTLTVQDAVTTDAFFIDALLIRSPRQANR